MRAIHYSVRYTLVLIVVLLFYLSLAFIFRQTVQPLVVMTLLLATVCAERMWILLDWVGPVVGTMDKKKQGQDQKQIIEYLLENSLRYRSPLVIAAIDGKKRMSLHVVARVFRKSDIVLRSSAGYLLVLMPFTSLEQASMALKRLVTLRLPIRDVVVTDVSMLQALAEAQGTYAKGVVTEIAVGELRRICVQAFDEKVAAVKANSARADVPVMYKLYTFDAEERASGQLEPASPNPEEIEVISAAKDENVTSDTR